MRNLGALLVIIFANGCFFVPGWGRDLDGDEDWPVGSDVYAVDAQIEEAWLGGHMADLGTFEGDAYEAEYQGGYGSSTITLHAGAAGGDEFGWAMIGLTTYAEGGFEGDTFAPGARLDASDGQLDALGCVGPDHGSWDFDGSAERLEIEVEEGLEPDSRLVYFRAFYDGQGVTEGSFVLVPNAATGSGDG